MSQGKNPAISSGIVGLCALILLIFAYGWYQNLGQEEDERKYAEQLQAQQARRASESRTAATTTATAGNLQARPTPKTSKTSSCPHSREYIETIIPGCEFYRRAFVIAWEEGRTLPWKTIERYEQCNKMEEQGCFECSVPKGKDIAHLRCVAPR